MTDLGNELITRWDYAYTGTPQTFTAPGTGTYRLEAWGAQGGTVKSAVCGYGGYTQGKIALAAGQKVYIYVGEAGSATKNPNDYFIRSTFNGGGQGGYDDAGYSGADAGASGGGATDFRLVGGDWNNALSLNSRIMVAGGGGGAEFAQINKGGSTIYAHGGDSGGLTGYMYGSLSGRGGSQTSGGSHGGYEGENGEFGIGGNGGYSHADTRLFGGGGGGGYYGGGAGGFRAGVRLSGGGGSSFISGMTGCVAIKPASGVDFGGISPGPAWMDGDGIVFCNCFMIDGQGYEWNTGQQAAYVTGMPNPVTGGTMTGNADNGYARITRLTED